MIRLYNAVKCKKAARAIAVGFFTLMLSVLPAAGCWGDLDDIGGMLDDEFDGYNVNLSSLELSDGVLTPVFSQTNINYTAEVSYSTLSISVIPIVAELNAEVTVDGTAVISGTSSESINLNVGDNTITVIVTAQDNITTKTYTVTVTRLAAYSVIYNANEATVGMLPTDPNEYINAQSVTVLNNSGNLAGAVIVSGIKQRFIGWNTNASATTALYVAGNTFSITADTTLYAIYTTGTDVLRKVGPAGGWVFYDAGSVQSWGRYLEAWNADEPEAYPWNTSYTQINTLPAIGEGYNNTYVIMAGASHQAAEATRIATHGGVTDWFLPSADEQYQMCWVLHSRMWNGSAAVDNPEYGANRVGGFIDNYYWNSTEMATNDASHQFFLTGRQYANNKANSCHVRAVRKF